MIDLKLSPKTDRHQLLLFQIDFTQSLIEHEKDKIAFAKVNIIFGNPPQIVADEAKNIIETARAKIGRLDFELRALQLQLNKEVNSYDKD